MADEPKPKRSRKIGFTVLEMGAPLNPSPEELASRRVEISFRQPITVLEMGAPLNPSPEELATRRVEPLINGDPVTPEPPAVPPVVQSMIVQLADAVGALEPAVRAAAINQAVAELTKRLAG
jgi:hypothetical protein